MQSESLQANTRRRLQVSETDDPGGIPPLCSPADNAFQLVPGNRLYGTPWGPAEGPSVPPKDVLLDEEDQQPLLNHAHAPSCSSSDGRRKVRFQDQGSEATITEQSDEFGRPRRPNPPPPVPYTPILKQRTSTSFWFPRQHPFWPRTFEAPRWPPVLLLLFVVILTYPILLLATIIANNRSLFWARFVVGIATTVTGVPLSLSLIEIGMRILEATTWATVIHNSVIDGRRKVTLSELHSKTRTSHGVTLLGLMLLWDRLRSRGTSRNYRPYDKRPWSIFVIYFILLSLISTCLIFVLGRLINIQAVGHFQTESYHQVAVAGDLSGEDIDRATFQMNTPQHSISSWTSSSFGTSRGLATPIRMEWQNKATGETEPVYFAEIPSNQLWEHGIGYGTFYQDGTDHSVTPQWRPSPDYSTNNQFPVGSIVRLARWGLRIKCQKLPDPLDNIVPLSPSERTYVFVPQKVLSDLHSSLNLPEIKFEWNSRNTLAPGEKIPSAAARNVLAWGASFENDGAAQSFSSQILSDGRNGTGWTQLEMVLVRLNKTYTPRGTFGRQGPDPNMGYDAAVCLEAIEPWVTDSYNTTFGDSVTVGIVSKGVLGSGTVNHGTREGGLLPGVSDSLSSIGKINPCLVAHDNSRTQILKDNGRNVNWVPSPTLVSWTDGFGPGGYTTLMESSLEQGLGMADASNFLPYLVGSRTVLAFQYPVITVVTVSIFLWQTMVTLAVIMLLGFIGTFFAPKLPLGIPRRDFSLLTWLVAYEGDNILDESVRRAIDRNTDLDELKRRFGDQKIRYGA